MLPGPLGAREPASEMVHPPRSGEHDSKSPAECRQSENSPAWPCFQSSRTVTLLPTAAARPVRRSKSAASRKRSSYPSPTKGRTRIHWAPAIQSAAIDEPGTLATEEPRRRRRTPTLRRSQAAPDPCCPPESSLDRPSPAPIPKPLPLKMPTENVPADCRHAHRCPKA